MINGFSLNLLTPFAYIPASMRAASAYNRIAKRNGKKIILQLMKMQQL